MVDVECDESDERWGDSKKGEIIGRRTDYFSSTDVKEKVLGIGHVTRDA